MRIKLGVYVGCMLLVHGTRAENRSATVVASQAVTMTAACMPATQPPLKGRRLPPGVIDEPRAANAETEEAGPSVIDDSSKNAPRGGVAGGVSTRSNTCPAANVGVLTDGGNIVGDTTGSTDDFEAGCDSNSGGQDEIFEFQVDLCGLWTFDSCTVPACWDTVLEIRQETGGGCPGDFLACDDNGCNVCYYESAVTAFLVPSATYYLIVDGWNSFAYGDFTITAALEPETCCQTDDDCQDGLFCNGMETCNVTTGACLPGPGNPCKTFEGYDAPCDENLDICPKPAPCFTWISGTGSGAGFFAADNCPNQAVVWVFDDVQMSHHTSGVLDFYTTPIVGRSTPAGAGPLGATFSVDQALFTVNGNSTCMPESVILGSTCTALATIDPAGTPAHDLPCSGTMPALPNNAGDFDRCEIDFWMAYRTSENGAGFELAATKPILGGPAAADEFGVSLIAVEDCMAPGEYGAVESETDDQNLRSDFANAVVCAKPIQPGDDCFRTECLIDPLGGPENLQTSVPFCQNPIPPDFFDPGSLAFAGTIKVGNVGGGSDTIVTRLDPIVHTINVPPDSTAIVLSALSLRNCEPIVVEYCDGRTEEWDVLVGLSGEQPEGTMTVTKATARGGTYSAEFGVKPKFTFTRRSDLAERVFEPGTVSELTTLSGGWWVSRLALPGSACSPDFVPGVAQHGDVQCCQATIHGSTTDDLGVCVRHGTVAGASIDCSASLCPSGACCIRATGSCTIAVSTPEKPPDPARTPKQNCTLANGEYKGNLTTCADGDNDGIPDVQESGDCCGPRDSCNTGTNPGDDDTDADGCLDGEEIAQGSDPCDPCDQPQNCTRLPEEDENENGIPDECETVGACCNVCAGSCEDGIEEELCIAIGGTPRGPATVCLGDNDGDGWDDICGCPPPPDPHITLQGTSATFGTLDVPVIPADFFFPGSGPFVGPVNLVGGPTDTLGQRSDSIDCPGGVGQPCNPVSVELVQLDLVSAGPITVLPGGTQWDVSVALSPTGAPPLGTLSPTLTHANGGTYGADIPFSPRFKFTEVGNPGNVRVLDYDIEGLPPIQINFLGVHWVVVVNPALGILAPNNGNFVPGVRENIPGDPNSQVVIQALGESKGGGIDHPVQPPPLPPPDPHITLQGTSATFGALDVPAIPADFFFPGSGPFVGPVNLVGGPTDTLGQRSDSIVCPDGVGQPCNPVSVELVQLDLVSAGPITVLPGGTQWDVAVALSPTGNPPLGTLSATLAHANGGTYGADIPFSPRFKFTEVGNPGNVRVLDYDLEGLPPIQINFLAVDWVVVLGPGLVGTIDAPNDGNFVPGVRENIPGDPNSQVVIQALGESKGGGIDHPVQTPPTGACCLDDDGDGHQDTCVDNVTKAQCVAADPLGSFDLGAVCSGIIGACCLDWDGDGHEDVCLNGIDQDCCLLQGGWFNAGGTCSGITGSCCLDWDGDGHFDTCTDGVDRDCCALEGGVFTPGATCSGIIGACCLDSDDNGMHDDICVEMDEDCCEAQGGWFMGAGSPCLGDGDGNGTDDACQTVEPPVRAPAPHNILKNRYISIDPTGASGNNPAAHHIRVVLVSSLVVGQVGNGPWWAGPPNAACISMVTPTKPGAEPNWSGCPIVHLTGCPIIPTSTYDLAVESGGTLSADASFDTQAKPAPKWHGDCVGAFSGTEWSGPNGQTNIDDAVAAIKTFQNPSKLPGCGAPPCNATHTSVTDVAPNLPPTSTNKIVNIEDVLIIILGFGGFEYPGIDLTQCP